MNKIIEIIKGLPKTLLLNFYYFDFTTAIHFPILVGGKCKILSLGDRKAIKCTSPKFGIMRVGLSNGSYEMGANEINRWSIETGGRMEIVDGPVYMNRGIGIFIGPSGEIRFMGKFFCNSNCLISANRRISFGADTLIGWDCKFIDGDGHQIIYSATKEIQKRDIIIGDHVWIGSETTILKGVNIGKRICCSNEFSCN